MAWLERAGHERITLLDNASTWEPLLDYLRESPHSVVRLGANLGSRAVWAAPEPLPDGFFVYTDPDLLPVEDCPADAIEHLHELLQRHTGYPKAALGLYLDDVTGILDPKIEEWEHRLLRPWPGDGWRGEIEPGVFGSLVDTTFALYRPGIKHHDYKGLRCGHPYQARHMSWYVTEPDDEDRYYLERATPGPEGSSWAQQFQER